MIRQAHEKARQAGVEGVGFVVGDAARLPFATASFDAVSCSHAMYELSPEVRDRTLQEAHRVLRPGGQFLMMEHCEPTRPLVRFLYGVRLSAMGSSRNRDFARDEVPFLRRFFADVKQELSPTGRSKLIRGVKDGDSEAVG
jgi:demethylmenaquinone methyltransferase/2-methoxy-6-polyprenyl-1,4-benzoquinol methylase